MSTSPRLRKSTISGLTAVLFLVLAVVLVALFGERPAGAVALPQDCFPEPVPRADVVVSDQPRILTEGEVSHLYLDLESGVYEFGVTTHDVLDGGIDDRLQIWVEPGGYLAMTQDIPEAPSPFLCSAESDGRRFYAMESGTYRFNLVGRGTVDFSMIYFYHLGHLPDISFMIQSGWNMTYPTYDDLASDTELPPEPILVPVATESEPEPEPEPVAQATNERVAPCVASRTLDPAHEARLFRLYSAYYLRCPDMGGWDFWMTNILSGEWSIRKISNFFADAPEFDRRYGNLNNGEFVDLVYSNIMDRAPDDEGRTYWLNRLSLGLTRGDLVLHFAESPEYKEFTQTS